MADLSKKALKVHNKLLETYGKPLWRNWQIALQRRISQVEDRGTQTAMIRLRPFLIHRCSLPPRHKGTQDHEVSLGLLRDLVSLW